MDRLGSGPQCESCRQHKVKQTISDGYRKLNVCNPCAKTIQEMKRKRVTQVTKGAIQEFDGVMRQLGDED